MRRYFFVILRTYNRDIWQDIFQELRWVFFWDCSNDLKLWEQGEGGRSLRIGGKLMLKNASARTRVLHLLWRTLCQFMKNWQRINFSYCLFVVWSGLQARPDHCFSLVCQQEEGSRSLRIGGELMLKNASTRTRVLHLLWCTLCQLKKNLPKLMFRYFFVIAKFRYSESWPIFHLGKKFTNQGL